MAACGPHDIGCMAQHWATFLHCLFLTCLSLLLLLLLWIKIYLFIMNIINNFLIFLIIILSFVPYLNRGQPTFIATVSLSSLNNKLWLSVINFTQISSVALARNRTEPCRSMPAASVLNFNRGPRVSSPGRRPASSVQSQWVDKKPLPLCFSFRFQP